MNLARAVRIARAARGLEQQTFARRLAVDPSYVSLIESGQREPSLGLLRKLSVSFNFPLHTLMLLAADEPTELETPDTELLKALRNGVVK